MPHFTEEKTKSKGGEATLATCRTGQWWCWNPSVSFQAPSAHTKSKALMSLIKQMETDCPTHSPRVKLGQAQCEGYWAQSKLHVSGDCQFLMSPSGLQVFSHVMTAGSGCIRNSGFPTVSCNSHLPQPELFQSTSENLSDDHSIVWNSIAHGRKPELFIIGEIISSVWEHSRKTIVNTTFIYIL